MVMPEKLRDIDESVGELDYTIADLAEAHFKKLGPERNGIWDQKLELPEGWRTFILRGYTFGLTRKCVVFQFCFMSIYMVCRRCLHTCTTMYKTYGYLMQVFSEALFAKSLLDQKRRGISNSPRPQLPPPLQHHCFHNQCLQDP